MYYLYFHLLEVVKIKDRYKKNISSLSIEENERLKDFSVCIIGCGGLGGYIIEMLARLGIGHLTLVDYDVFEESNLNRQILCKEDSIGISKVEIGKNRIKEINSDVEVTFVKQELKEDNCKEIIKNHDVVIDALDSISTRFILQNSCENLGIPMIHGAIGGWFGQVCTIFPGDNTLSLIYKNGIDKGIEKSLGNPAFTPANIASIQVGEVIKILLSKGSILRNKLLIVDLLYNEYNIIEFNNN